jgi:hypothetical protein
VAAWVRALAIREFDVAIKSERLQAPDETARLRAALEECHRALRRCEEMIRKAEQHGKPAND